MGNLDRKYSGYKNQFSVIEISVVLAILVVVSFLAYPQYIKLKIKAAQTEMRINLRTISTLAVAYDADHSSFPKALLLWNA